MKKLVAGLIGFGLILLAFIPTPDDITVVSPLIQFWLGVSLLSFAIGFHIPGALITDIQEKRR